MNEKVSGFIKLYTKLDGFIHDFYRFWWSWSYSRGQLRDAKKVYKDWRPLTKAQKKKIAAFWGLKHTVPSDFMTHEIMMNVKGEFDVRYCPERVYRFYIDPGLSDRRFLWAWDDKGYFERHQPGLPFPHTYVRNIKGYFLDYDYKPINKEEARSIIAQNLPVIVKPTLISGEGKNLRMVSSGQQIDEIFKHYDNDYVVQELLVQCDELKKLSARSVCSFRIVTAMVNGEPRRLTSHLLGNTTDSVAVNKNTGPGEGVIIIKTDENGRLADTGYFENAKKFKALPSGFAFGGMQIPGFKEAVDLAIEAHKSMPMFGVIGFDVTVDESGKPVFIEWNLRGIEIYHSQLSNGPLFGQYSDYFAQKVREIIKKRKTYVPDHI